MKRLSFQLALAFVIFCAVHGSHSLEEPTARRRATEKRTYALAYFGGSVSEDAGGAIPFNEARSYKLTMTYHISSCETEIDEFFMFESRDLNDYSIHPRLYDLGSMAYDRGAVGSPMSAIIKYNETSQYSYLSVKEWIARLGHLFTNIVVWVVGGEDGLSDLEKITRALRRIKLQQGLNGSKVTTFALSGLSNDVPLHQLLVWLPQNIQPHSRVVKVHQGR